MVRLRELHETYGDRVQFLFVYVHDAGHALPVGFKDDVQVPDEPAKFQLYRRQQACEGMELFHLDFPCLMDTVEGNVQEVYRGFPKRLFVIDRTGHMVLDSGPVPFEPFPWQEIVDRLNEQVSPPFRPNREVDRRF